MSFSKRFMVGILSVCMSISLITGIFLTFGASAAEQTNKQEKMIAVIDSTDTGFQEATAVSEWSSVFDWQWMGIGAGATITIKFTEPIDTAEYQYATFKALNWNTYKDNDYTSVELKNGNGEIVETIQLRAHVDPAAVSTAYTQARIDLRQYADSEGLVAGIQFQFAETWGEHLIISNFECFSDSPGKIDAISSGFDDAHTVSSWSSVFDYEKMNIDAGGIVTIKFIEPIDTKEYPYAYFTSLIWSPVNSVSVELLTMDDKVVETREIRAHESTSVIATDNTTRGILLSEYADSEGIVEGLKLRFPSDFGLGHLLITDFTCENKLPDVGTIDYRASGLALASNEAWNSVFTYEKVEVGRDTVLKIYFAVPIDTEIYPYVTFNAMYWGVGPWYQTEFGDLDGNIQCTDFVRGAYDTNGNNEVGLDLRDFADDDGLVRGITIQCKNLPEWGAEYSSYFICTNFTCETEVPSVKPSEPGILNWKLSGLSNATSVEIWKEVFDYEKSGVTSNGTISLYFEAPIDTNEYPYATIDVMFWGSPGLISVQTAKFDGTLVETWDIQMFWGEVAKEFPDTFIGIELAKYADADGMLEGLVLQPMGLPDVGETYSGHFLITDFVCETEIKYPQDAEDAGIKDISEILPVGDGYTVQGTTAGEEGASENFVSLNISGCDVLDMNITVNYTDKYSFYFLVKALRTDDIVTEKSFNGFLFMFTQDGMKIGAEINGTLRWVTAEQMVFENGKETSVRISAVPCYFRNNFYGYHLSAQMGDFVSEPLYVEYSKVNAGNILSIATQNVGKEFSFSIGAESEEFVTSQKMMNVSVSAASAETFVPRMPLNLSHTEFEGETVSELKVSGDAFYDKTTGYLIFNSEGTVTVSYTVTNQFGTFQSNELTITYTKENTEGESNGCGSSVIGIARCASVCMLVGIAIIVYKKKHA